MKSRNSKLDNVSHRLNLNTNTKMESGSDRDNGAITKTNLTIDNLISSRSNTAQKKSLQRVTKFKNNQNPLEQLEQVISRQEEEKVDFISENEPFEFEQVNQRERNSLRDLRKFLSTSDENNKPQGRLFAGGQQQSAEKVLVDHSTSSHRENVDSDFDAYFDNDDGHHITNRNLNIVKQERVSELGDSPSRTRSKTTKFLIQSVAVGGLQEYKMEDNDLPSQRF